MTTGQWPEKRRLLSVSSPGPEKSGLHRAGWKGQREPQRGFCGYPLSSLGSLCQLLMHRGKTWSKRIYTNSIMFEYSDSGTSILWMVFVCFLNSYVFNNPKWNTILKIILVQEQVLSTSNVPNGLSSSEVGLMSCANSILMRKHNCNKLPRSQRDCSPYARVLATKPDDLTLIPRVYMADGEPSCPLTPVLHHGM